MPKSRRNSCARLQWFRKYVRMYGRFVGACLIGASPVVIFLLDINMDFAFGVNSPLVDFLVIVPVAIMMLSLCLLQLGLILFGVVFLAYIIFLLIRHVQFSLMQLVVAVFLNAFWVSLIVSQKGDVEEVAMWGLVILVLSILRYIIRKDPLNEDEGYVLPLHGYVENFLKRFGVALPSRR